jgi:peptide-methionine (R)-S-oxide reductase
MKRRDFLFGTTAMAAIGALAPLAARAAEDKFAFALSDAEWRKRLTPEQYAVLRQHGTERPGSSPLDREHRKGVFACAGCDQSAYLSETKFDSGTGWPSFYAPIEGAIGMSEDRQLLLFVRTEVHCSRCGGHLGHVFDDGPKPTGKRYCMNGVALKFAPA